jgi:hypothetical protein
MSQYTVFKSLKNSMFPLSEISSLIYDTSTPSTSYKIYNNIYLFYIIYINIYIK